MTKLGLFCDRLLEACWLLAIATVPMYFNIYSSRVFEPDKIIILRGLVLVMALAQLIKWLEGPLHREGAAAPEKPGADFSRPSWRLWQSNPLALPALLLIATFLLGTVASVTPSTALWGSYQRLQGTYSMVTYILLFFLMVANLRRPAQLERIFNVILLVSLPISLYGLVESQGRDPLPWGGDVQSRVTSTMGNAIFLAAYLIMVVPITLFRLIGAFARGRRFVRRSGEAPWAGVSTLLVLCAILLAEIVFFALFTTGASASPNLWWAALPMVGAFVGLSVLFRIPRPTLLTQFAEVTGYSLLLALQLVTIFLTASRGPQLGLIAGLACFGIVVAIRSRSRWLLTGMVGAVLSVLLFLVLFNLPNSPLAPLRSTPYVGRLGSLLETEAGTGRVRLLIWQGDLKLMTSLPPVGLSSSDPLGIGRLLVGYGPESMYVAYNKVYPADLAHFEARNASPDRSHNDTLDYLVTVGVLGLLAYLFVLVSAVCLIWQRLRRTSDLDSQLPLVAVLSAIVAHFVESQTGIVIAATRTYFWAYLAVVVATGVLYKRSSQENAAATRACEEGPLNVAIPALSIGSSGTRRARRRGGLVSDTNGRSCAKNASLELDRVSPYPVALMAWVVVVAVLVLSRMQYFRNFEAPLYAAFAVLLASGVSIALSLGRLPAVKVWRLENWWLYGGSSLIVAYLIGANLNVVAADTYYKTGFNLDQSRQFDAAVPQYNAALRLASDQDYYYLFLARSYLELAKATQRPNSVPAFEPTAEKLLDITPAQLTTLGRDDLLQTTRVVLERARDLNPLNPDHYANLARLYRTWAAMAGDPGKLDQSDIFYSQAVTLIPQSARLYDEWAQLALEKGDTARALARVESSIEIDPVFPVTFALLGDIYLRLGRHRGALEAHGKALALDPLALSDQQTDQRLSTYEKAGLLSEVAGLFASSAQRAAHVPGARASYGYLLWRIGKPEKALEEFQAGARLAPNDWTLQRNIALVQQALGQIDQAISSTQAALRLAPSDQASNLQTLLSDLQKKKR